MPKAGRKIKNSINVAKARRSVKNGSKILSILEIKKEVLLI